MKGHFSGPTKRQQSHVIRFHRKALLMIYVVSMGTPYS